MPKLVPLTFGWSKGDGIPGLVDPLGRTFNINPYNIPQWKYKVLHFCVRFILTMIDTRVITIGRDQAFDKKEELYAFQEMLRQVRNSLMMFRETHRERSMWIGDAHQPILLDPGLIRKNGKQHSFEACTQPNGLHSNPILKKFDEMPKVKTGHSLVAVITVTEFGSRGENHQKIGTWDLAVELDENTLQWLDDAHPNGYYAYEFFEVSRKFMRPGDQEPQFACKPPR